MEQSRNLAANGHSSYSQTESRPAGSIRFWRDNGAYHCAGCSIWSGRNKPRCRGPITSIKAKRTDVGEPSRWRNQRQKDCKIGR